jgi:hypothetical protein
MCARAGSLAALALVLALAWPHVAAACMPGPGARRCARRPRPAAARWRSAPRAAPLRRPVPPAPGRPTGARPPRSPAHRSQEGAAVLTAVLQGDRDLKLKPVTEEVRSNAGAARHGRGAA